MYKNNYNKIHFIGICGISMQHLALLAKQCNYVVTGSDMTYSDTINVLLDKGINAYVGSQIDVVKDADLVVYSSAINKDNEELKYAKFSKIPCMERCEYLRYIESSMKTSVCIAGSHGKSTATALLGSILGSRATTHVGAHVKGVEFNYNGDDLFVTEACEYRRSFLKLRPSIGVVLNIDFDHPDEYSSIDDIREAFDEFMANSQVVIAHDSVKNDNAITFGTSERATYRIVNIHDNGGKYDFDIRHNGGIITHINSPLYGKHNINNVAVAYIVASMLGMENDEIIKGINEFNGLNRRFEIKGCTKNNALVISDYAHHPSEIAKVISTAHEITNGKITVVFEPHTYSRTRSLIDGFMECFYWADSLVLLPTYSARESEKDGYSTLNLLTCLHQVGEYPLYFDSYKRACEYLVKMTSSKDIILVLGAGSVDMLADMLVK